jgi:hypothetical protein
MKLENEAGGKGTDDHFGGFEFRRLPFPAAWSLPERVTSGGDNSVGYDRR